MCVDNRKRDFWGPYPWPLDLHQYSFPISSKKSAACYTSLRMPTSNKQPRKIVKNLQIRHEIFHQKRMSLWMWRCQNCFPIVSLWASLRHIQFVRRRCNRRSMSLWMRCCWNGYTIIILRPSIHHIWFAQSIYHLIKVPTLNSTSPESWPERKADWAIFQAKRRAFSRSMIIRRHPQLKHQWNIPIR